jgi:hypothetical protein
MDKRRSFLKLALGSFSLFAKPVMSLPTITFTEKDTQQQRDDNLKAWISNELAESTKEQIFIENQQFIRKYKTLSQADVAATISSDFKSNRTVIVDNVLMSSSECARYLFCLNK